MKKIYTFSNSFTLFTLSLTLLLSSHTLRAQVCGSVAENFDNTAGSTAGFTGNFSSGTNGADGYLLKDKVLPTGVYSITSPTYQLPGTATSLGYGFTLEGTVEVARAAVKVIYISTLNNELTTFYLGQVNPTYNSGTSSVCLSVPLSTLPGFPVAGQYRIQIELTPETGNGNVGQTITFDDFATNGTLSQSPLPVTFIGFEAKRVNGNIALTWKVAGEENVKRYEVERSTDGHTYIVIGGSGKTGQDIYQITDPTPPAVAFYRVRNVDNDGKYKYSAVVHLVNGRSEILVKAFPQPVQDQKLTVQHSNVSSSKALISLSAVDGRLVRSLVPAAGSMQSYVDMSGLQKGLYTLRIDMGDGSVQFLKVVKQ